MKIFAILFVFFVLAFLLSVVGYLNHNPEVIWMMMCWYVGIATGYVALR